MPRERGRRRAPPSGRDREPRQLSEEQEIIAALPHIRPDGSTGRRLPVPPLSEAERIERSPLAAKLHGPRRPAPHARRHQRRTRPVRVDPLSSDEGSPTRRRRPRAAAQPALSPEREEQVALALSASASALAGSESASAALLEPPSPSVPSAPTEESEVEGSEAEEAEQGRRQEDEDEQQRQQQQQQQQPPPPSGPGGKKKGPQYSLDKLRAEEAEARLASVQAERNELQSQLDAITHQLQANNADEANIKGRLQTIQAALNRAKQESSQVSSKLELKFKERLAAKTAAHESELVRMREEHAAEIAALRTRITQLEALVASGGGGGGGGGGDGTAADAATGDATAAAAPAEGALPQVAEPAADVVPAAVAAAHAEALHRAELSLAEARAEMAHERERVSALSETNAKLERELELARDRVSQSESTLGSQETNAELVARLRAMEAQLNKTRRLEDTASSMEQERHAKETALREQLESRAEDMARAELEHDVQSKIIRHLQDRLSEATSAKHDAIALVQANELQFERTKNNLADEWSQKVMDCEQHLAKARSDKAMLNKLVQQLEDRLAVAQAHAVVSRPLNSTHGTEGHAGETGSLAGTHHADEAAQTLGTSTIPHLQMLVDRMERDIRHKDGELRRLQLENAEMVAQLAGERDGAMSDLTSHVSMSRTKASQYEGELHALRAQVAALSEEKALLAAALDDRAPTSLPAQARAAAGVAKTDGGVPTASQDAVLAAVHAGVERERQRHAVVVRTLEEDLHRFRAETAATLAELKAARQGDSSAVDIEYDVTEARTELAGLRAELVVLKGQLEAAHADRSALAERARTLTQRLAVEQAAEPAVNGRSAAESQARAQNQRKAPAAGSDAAAASSSSGSSALSREVRNQLAQEHASKNKEAIMERLRRSQGEAAATRAKSSARSRSGSTTLDQGLPEEEQEAVPLDKHLRDEQNDLHVSSLGQQLLSRTVSIPVYKVISKPGTESRLRRANGEAGSKDLSVTLSHGMSRFTFHATDHLPAESSATRADASVDLSAEVTEEQAKALVRQSLLRQRTKTRLCGLEGATTKEWTGSLGEFLLGLLFLRDDAGCTTLVVQHAPKRGSSGAAGRQVKPVYSGGQQMSGQHVMVTVFAQGKDGADGLRAEVYNPETLLSKSLLVTKAEADVFASDVTTLADVAERVASTLDLQDGELVLPLE